MDKIQDAKLKIKIEKKPRCTVELEIIAPADLVKSAQKEAIKDLKKEVELPGFRKGKAPDEMVLKKFPESLKNKWEKRAADLAFIGAHKQEKLPPLGSSTKIIFKLKEFSLENGATITYSYETDPEIPAVDISSIKLKRVKKHIVTDEEVEEAIRQIRFFHAKWNEVQRPIQEGDYIIIDLDSLDNDAKVRVFNDTRFEVSDKGMTKWMKELVLDANLNDSLEGISQPDEDLSEEEKKKFESKKVLVTIKKIEEAALPEIDDDFAKKIGASSVDEMYSSIKEMLIKQAEVGHDEQNRKAVQEYLLKTYSFDIPNSLLESEIEHRRNNALANANFKKKYDHFNEKEKKEFEKTLLKHADDSIRIFYLSKKIINDNKIKISDDEIKQAAMNILYKEIGQKADPKDIPKDIYALALSRLVLIKAEDYILDQTSEI
ncbi:MAG: trigger factor [Parachlamydiales bacterium]